MNRGTPRRTSRIVLTTTLMLAGILCTAAGPTLAAPDPVLIPQDQPMFEVWELMPGTYGILELAEFEWSQSYLVLGSEQAILFDTGIGTGDIRRVVEQLTDLEIIVINSHTHYDHVGGNHLFDHVWCLDDELAVTSSAGLSNSELKAFYDHVYSVVDWSFEDPDHYVRPFTISRWLHDGDVIDIGGRELEIFAVPGHTSDSLVMLDRANRLLFAGDSLYDCVLFIHCPSSDLFSYWLSLSRLRNLRRHVDWVLGGHCNFLLSSDSLRTVHRATTRIVTGRAEYEEHDWYRAYDFRRIETIFTKNPPLACGSHRHSESWATTDLSSASTNLTLDTRPYAFAPRGRALDTHR